MTTTLARLWYTPALTTPTALLARSAETGRVAVLIRQCGDEWRDLDDNARETAAKRLLFARFRLNPRGALRRRGTQEDAAMRTVWSEVASAVVTLVAIVGALVSVAVTRVWRAVRR